MRSESFGIETYSMLQDRDIAEDAAVFDSGDLELPFGAPDRALEMIEARESEILGAGKIPFLLGGEHLVTLGAVRAAVKRHPDLRIVHFDAHADLREDYLGVKLSHACVLRRCHDLLGDGRIFQFGVRSGTRDERSFMLDGHVTTELFSDATLPEVVEKIGREAPVYLTVDMDVLDPAEFPGTGTPEAGGLSFTRLVDDVRLICGKLNIVALDNVELSPALDPTGRSTALACKFLREELLSVCNR
jgi:agmatinase